MPQNPAILGLKNAGIRADTAAQGMTDWRHAHPWIAATGDFLTGGATNPEQEMGPADVAMHALPLAGLAGLAGRGVRALGEEAPAMKRAVMRPDAIRHEIANDPYGQAPEMGRRGFFDRVLGNPDKRADKEEPIVMKRIFDLEEADARGAFDEYDPVTYPYGWHEDPKYPGQGIRQFTPEEKALSAKSDLFDKMGNDKWDRDGYYPNVPGPLARILHETTKGVVGDVDPYRAGDTTRRLIEALKDSLTKRLSRPK